MNEGSRREFRVAGTPWVMSRPCWITRCHSLPRLEERHEDRLATLLWIAADRQRGRLSHLPTFLWRPELRAPRRLPAEELFRKALQRQRGRRLPIRMRRWLRHRRRRDGLRLRSSSRTSQVQVEVEVEVQTLQRSRNVRLRSVSRLHRRRLARDAATWHGHDADGRGMQRLCRWCSDDVHAVDWMRWLWWIGDVSDSQ